MDELNKSDSGKYLIYAFASIVALLLIILLFAKYIPLLNKEETVKYRFFDFVKKDTHWYTTWQDNKKRVFDVPFRFNPYEALETVMEGSLNDSFNENTEIYITFDPLTPNEKNQYLALATSELVFSLSGPLNKKTIMACSTNETKACQNRPIIDCNSDKSVIFLKSEKPAKILMNKNCITIQGNELNLLRSVDRLLFQWYKIIQ